MRLMRLAALSRSSVRCPAAARRAAGALSLAALGACGDSPTGNGSRNLLVTGPASVAATRTLEMGGPTMYECDDVTLRVEAVGNQSTVVRWRGVWFSQHTASGGTAYRRWFPPTDLADWLNAPSLRAGEVRELLWYTYASSPHRAVIEIEYSADGRDQSAKVAFDCR